MSLYAHNEYYVVDSSVYSVQNGIGRDDIEGGSFSGLIRWQEFYADHSHMVYLEINPGDEVLSFVDGTTVSNCFRNAMNTWNNNTGTNFHRLKTNSLFN